MRQIISFFLAVIMSGASAADIYVVAHSNSPIDHLSREEVRDLYLGRTKALPNGKFAVVYDRAESSDLRARFYKHVAGMGLAQVDAFWARLVFAGRMLPLEQVHNDEKLAKTIASRPSAISYLGSPPNDPNLKVVYRIEE